MQMLDSRGGSGAGAGGGDYEQSGGSPKSQQAAPQQRSNKGFDAPPQSSPAPGGFDDFDDDIPF